MKPAAYLDAVKSQLDLSSDYALSKALKVSTGTLAEIRNEGRGMPLVVAFNVAIILNLDPAEVVADLESQREKNPSKRAFWESFTSRARQVTAVTLCTLALIFSGIYGNAQSQIIGFFRNPKNA